jgi:molybdopterin converting factor small subunit
MSLFSTLRKKWRQHDETEHAYRDGDTLERLEEHEHAEAGLASARAADGAVDRAIQSEDALEHEEPQ